MSSAALSVHGLVHLLSVVPKLPHLPHRRPAGMTSELFAFFHKSARAQFSIQKAAVPDAIQSF